MSRSSASVAHALTTELPALLTLVFESLDGRSLYVRPLHTKSLCVNMVDESRVLAKKAVASLECVEWSGGGDTTAITQRQDCVLSLLQLREDHQGEDSRFRELSCKSETHANWRNQ